MKKLINDVEEVLAQSLRGFAAANADLVELHAEPVFLARAGAPFDGKVAVISGGGSGHEPLHGGFVGRGMLTAACPGQVFTSPTPDQMLAAAQAVEGGAGVLFIVKNYTGDVMNFGMAQEGLAEHGIEARSFVTTDDIASAPADQMHERRGIAGNFFVFKVAGAAADLGLSLDEVEAAARRANDATRTMGVALSACSMPQTGKPNFHIPAGEMEIGMGIHGEPGVERIPAETADAVTDRLLTPILDELAPGAGDTVAVLVNGLGSTTLLELYLLHRRVAETLGERGVNIHHSWVGEYCTSLEMGGASVTLIKLDDDLRRWLDHPCDTPALRVGAADNDGPRVSRSRRRRAGPSAAARGSRGALNAEGGLTPAIFRAMLTASAEAAFAERDRLSELDGAIGDGDHGITMEIGWKQVLARLEAADEDATITELCRTAAHAFLEGVGASVGPLYGSGFAAAAEAVANRLNLDAAATVAWLAGLSEGIQTRGGAEPGEKTMVDVWVPAVAAAREALAKGGTIQDCLDTAAEAAEAGAEATRDMQSRRGRSKKLGERSIGHIDPGAASAAAMIAAWRDAVHTALND